MGKPNELLFRWAQVERIKEKYVEGYLSEDTLAAALHSIKLESYEINSIVEQQMKIKQQYAGSNIRPLPRRDARMISTVIRSMPERNDAT